MPISWKPRGETARFPSICNTRQRPQWETAQRKMELQIRCKMLVLHTGYDTARHHHGGATMLQILQLTVTRAQRICKTYMQAFIKDNSTRHHLLKKKGIEWYVDADWFRSWQNQSSDNMLSSHSWNRYVIMYAGCPTIWASKMQYLIALRTT